MRTTCTTYQVKRPENHEESMLLGTLGICFAGYITHNDPNNMKPASHDVRLVTKTFIGLYITISRSLYKEIEDTTSRSFCQSKSLKSTLDPSRNFVISCML